MVYKRDYLFEQIGGMGRTPTMGDRFRMRLKEAIALPIVDLEINLQKYLDLIDDAELYNANRNNSKIINLIARLRERISQIDNAFGVPLTDLFN